MKIQETICDISGFFFRWINTIDLSKAQKKSNLEKIIRGDTDFVLSFNYTETLERIYGVCKHNICHIHGTRETNYEEQKRKFTFLTNAIDLSPLQIAEHYKKQVAD
jgi:hypothetical protein